MEDEEEEKDVPLEGNGDDSPLCDSEGEGVAEADEEEDQGDESEDNSNGEDDQSDHEKEVTADRLEVTQSKVRNAYELVLIPMD